MTGEDEEVTTNDKFLSSRARRRYWARSYAGWRQFTATQPSATHTALATLDKAGRIDLMITQNVDRVKEIGEQSEWIKEPFSIFRLSSQAVVPALASHESTRPFWNE
ncbi:hypothetical protein JHK85_000608 [Glycine max]|nr:hypothetical protein JHK85_000608 [Glycine max]KAG5087980.1 hypothetical protein JHK86_000592 [Glycine max]